MDAWFSGPCECAVRDERLIDGLVSVWESSVRATHAFLSEEDIVRIRTQVRAALAGVGMLYVVTDNSKHPVAFMGVAGNELEMLFVHPDCFGRGIGGQMLSYAVRMCGVRRLCVNEDNPRAVAFYGRHGFVTVGRRECDDFGNRFPLLTMELNEPESGSKPVGEMN